MRRTPGTGCATTVRVVFIHPFFHTIYTVSVRITLAQMEEPTTIAAMFESFLAQTQKSVARVEVLGLENSKLRAEMMEIERMIKDKDKLVEEKNAEIEELMQKQKSSIADFRAITTDVLVKLRCSSSVEHHQFVVQSANVRNQQLTRQLMSQKNEIERLNRLNKELADGNRKQY